MESGTNEFCSEWAIADIRNNSFVWLGNISDLESMGTFLSTDEEI